MKWLLWREYRLNRLILVTEVVLLLLPYLFVLVALPWANVPANQAAGYIAAAFGVAAVYSLTIAQLTVALLGGNAIAGERADRSAEFIAYLPLPRTRRLICKLVLAFCATVLIWGLNLPVLLILWSLFPDELALRIDNAGYIVAYIAITGLTFYGVSWLISSFQSSPTFAVCGGLIVPLLVVSGLSAVTAIASLFIENPGYADRFIAIGYLIICAAFAIACFATGTWYYLKRIEP
jgi:ABC-type transport system involved in multi-copper enzyme maturation permease subunit